jgi:hypothetical protein
VTRSLLAWSLRGLDSGWQLVIARRLTRHPLSLAEPQPQQHGERGEQDVTQVDRDVDVDHRRERDDAWQPGLDEGNAAAGNDFSKLRFRKDFKLEFPKTFFSENYAQNCFFQ